MPRGRKGRRTKAMVGIAGERIDMLFSMAEREALAHRYQRSDRDVELARKIGMRYNVRIPGHFRRRFCKHCHAYLLPGRNCRTRLSGKTVTVHCEKCGRFMRMHYKAR
ncbi:MAG: ribonuclease P [Thermoplasmata archaeon]|nr:MAG: ribonuclease P [Thermoplasmata archaeon]